MRTLKIKGETYLVDDMMATEIGQFFAEKLTDNTWEIFDELPFSIQAKFANTYYTQRVKSK